ncbi:MAG TPA: AmmeMemoRadiSam system radical SAM enzyme [Candidatus Omnitrophota bacterium]|nr:AmmeMemoRadiSam system radical SAM enzyme [Candidatus Omnitrophota bacterium]HPD85451.1 AmmeMemoRadiSam system radical SAM enzyme [Candidatus Omnitrophota bacterium]HRZ04048.1 AmmeMemoRadiSam system radical SAM enzyme [Candidatus Omnitrophota bacterium]
MAAQSRENFVGRFWKKLENNKVACQLCPRFCILGENQRGFCFVRENVGGELILTTYGRSSGFCIDPIEKKPLNHFYPGTGILSFGTAGCNLGCKFCQNWDLSKSAESDRLTEKVTPKQIAQYAKQTGCKSVAFTYNDPVVFAEYAIAVADACHAAGVLTVAVTAGYIAPEARKEFFGCMDAANVDLKAFTDRFYREIASGTLKPVLDTLVYLKQKTKVWLEITTLIIPGENDSDNELAQMTEWIVENLGNDVPLHFTAFHPDFKMRNVPATPTGTLKRARDIAISKGIRYVYTGNIHDQEGQSTYCHACKKMLIERNWYELGEYHINNGRCAYCGVVCSGHFENTPGGWGSKRQPVYFQ